MSAGDREDAVSGRTAEDRTAEDRTAADRTGPDPTQGIRRVAAQRLAGFGESVIREMTRLAVQHGAVNLSQGFPDFAAPEEVKDAAIAAIRADVNQYAVTWGMPAFRRAIAEQYAARGWPEIDADAEVTVACGATETIAAAILALVDEGDEIVVFEPLHESYAPAAMLAGARVVPVPLRPPSWTFEVEDLERSIGPRTRAIILTNPHNPTGRVFTADELDAIARLCREHDLLAVTDEIYEHIVYEGEHLFLAQVSGMRDRTVTVSAMSKTYAVTGWRVGWAVAAPPLTDAIRKVHDFMTIAAPAPFQAAGVAALGLGPEYYRRTREDYRSRLETALQIAASSGIETTRPEGAYYLLGDVSPHMDALGVRDSADLVRWLIREARIALVPGSALYLTPEAGRTRVRLAFSKRAETLGAAGERLASAARILGVPVFAQRQATHPVRLGTGEGSGSGGWAA